MPEQEQPISGKLRFDPVVTWGHIIILIGFLISGFGVYMVNQRQTDNLIYRINTLENIAAETKQANKDLLTELRALTRELTDIRLKIGDRPPSGIGGR